MSGYYPAELTDWSPDAPWNEPEVPEQDFDVTCSQTLSKTVVVTTCNYIPGASGVDYEPDDEGGYYASGWHDPDDTSDTNWEEEYGADHYTPLQLIELFKRYLDDILNNTEDVSKHPSFIKHLMQECEGWAEDELEVVQD